MTIINILQNRSPGSIDRGLVLRDGNIVSGKILKVFPNNQAEIQIGNHTLIAKVTTPITVGEQYYFQIQRNDQMIQLKVLGEQLKRDQTENVISLMQRLGLKITKANIQFIQQLIIEKIPFQRDQLIHALHLLENKLPNKEVANVILQKMIAQKIPITNAIFHAFLTKETNTLTTNIHLLINELQKMNNLTNVEKDVLHALKQMLGRQTDGQSIPSYTPLDKEQKQLLFQILQQNGIVRHGVTFLEWENQMQHVIDSSNSSQLPNNFKLTDDWNAISQNVSTILTNKAMIQSIANHLIQHFFPSLGENTLTDSQFATMKNIIINQLLPLLPSETHHVLHAHLMNNNLQDNTQILQLLQMYSQNETFELLHNFQLMRNEGIVPPTHGANQFLSYIQHYMTTFGLAEEHQLSLLFHSNLDNVQEAFSETRHMISIKSMLIQMIQQGNQSSMTESAQRLLHFINGMQLQSVQESHYTVQAMLQLPGEKLGLLDDIWMQFEGKKLADGKLDPDFCRILFILQLHHLKETIVDMHVQKRTITMTIFNDIANKETVKQFESSLNERLQSLHYQLSTIRLKMLHERNQGSNTSQPISKGQSTGEGIEFFV